MYVHDITHSEPHSFEMLKLIVCENETTIVSTHRGKLVALYKSRMSTLFLDKKSEFDFKF